MTLDLWWGHLKNMLLSLGGGGGPSPNPMMPLSRVLPTKSSSHRAFLRNLTPADPCMTFDPIKALLRSGVLPIKLGCIRHSWAIWPLADPYMNFDPRNALHFGQGSSHHIWWPLDISKTTLPLDDLGPLESLGKYALKPRGQSLPPCQISAPYPEAWGKA